MARSKQFLKLFLKEIRCKLQVLILLKSGNESKCIGKKLQTGEVITNPASTVPIFKTGKASKESSKGCYSYSDLTFYKFIFFPKQNID